MSTLLTVKQAAAALGLHPDTVYRMLASGEIKGVRIASRSIRIREEAVEAVLTPI